MGKALLVAAEEDARSRDAQGMVAWGLSLPFWMKASWFKKHGYSRVDRDGMAELVWKPFTEDAQRPQWMVEKKEPEPLHGKVTVTAFLNGWCPAQNLIFERAKRAAASFGDKVVFQEINTFDRPTMLEWGMVDGLFINGRKLKDGPPPSYEKIHRMIARKVKKLSK